jgi:hypothetical protein
MRAERLTDSDLDNLAKPVLDTLFLARYSQVKDPLLAGALFRVDDCVVYRLSIEKCLATSSRGEGVDITVQW